MCAIYLRLFHRDDKAFSAINDPCFHKLCPIRGNIDDNIGCFNLKFSGICNVRCHESRFFSCCKLILLVKAFKFFIFYAAVLKETFYLMFCENDRFWFVFLCLNNLIQLFVNGKDSITGAILSRIPSTMAVKESLCFLAESGATQPKNSLTKSEWIFSEFFV